MYSITTNPIEIENEETMATNEERLMILRMVEDGKISAEEGTRLLKALGSEEGAPAPQSSASPSRFMRVRVTDLVTGKQKVSVNIPLALVTFGLRFVPETDQIDKGAIQAAIDSGLTGRIVDVLDDEDGHHVEVFLD